MVRIVNGALPDQTIMVITSGASWATRRTKGQSFGVFVPMRIEVRESAI